MRDVNLTSGQESMESFVVKTTPEAMERLNVFRATPFEFDVTALAMTATAVVGNTTVIDTCPLPGIQDRIENSSALPMTAPATPKRR